MAGRKGPPPIPLEVKLARAVEMPSGCIEYGINPTRHGYGRVSLSGTKLLAHRAAWVLAHGPIPDQLHVLHRCDNPPCVNPEHLFLGTQAINMADKASKGRAQRGTTHAMHKLTDTEVRQIRARRGETHRCIATEFGVSRGLIGQILNGTIWRHLLPQEAN